MTADRPAADLLAVDLIHVQIHGPADDDEWAVRCDRCTGDMWLDVGLTHASALSLAHNHAAATRHRAATAIPVRTVTASDAVAAKRHRQPDIDLLRRARDAVAYSYEAGDLPGDTPDDVLRFVDGDGGLLNLYDLAITLLQQRQARRRYLRASKEESND